MTKQTNNMPEIVKKALRETVIDIGQLSKEEKKILNVYTVKGWLSKGKGSSFPALKTVWGFLGRDFQADRKAEIEAMFRDCEALGEIVVFKNSPYGKKGLVENEKI